MKLRTYYNYKDQNFFQWNASKNLVKSINMNANLKNINFKSLNNNFNPVNSFETKKRFFIFSKKKNIYTKNTENILSPIQLYKKKSYNNKSNTLFKKLDLDLNFENQNLDYENVTKIINEKIKNIEINIDDEILNDSYYKIWVNFIFLNIIHYLILILIIFLIKIILYYFKKKKIKILIILKKM